MLRNCSAFFTAAALLALPAAGGRASLGGAGPAARPVSAPVERPRAQAPVKPRATTPFIPHGARTSSRRKVTVPAPRQVLLTFDDGPDENITPTVLAELSRRGLRAVFFVAGHRLMGNGPRATNRRQLVRRMVADGHLVANHTVSHVDLCQASAEKMSAEIDGNSELVTATTGVRPLVFRPPFGAACPELDQALAARGLPNLGWTIDPQDWRRPPSAHVTAFVIGKLKTLSGNAVVLLHDTRWSGVQALPAILDFVEAEQVRSSRGQTSRIEIVDPRVLFPESQLPETGLRPVLGAVAGLFSVLPRALDATMRTHVAAAPDRDIQ